LSSYEAVVGQKYHPPLKCTMSELRECRPIHQRLRLSPDSWLETYVQEHKIVDIEVLSALNVEYCCLVLEWDLGGYQAVGMS
jgi:hypothetical protein